MMDLTLLFDHRFCRDNKNTIFSLKNYDYQFFLNRYLTVFNHVDIVARVANSSSATTLEKGVEGPGVRVISLGNWSGPLELVLKTPLLANQVKARWNQPSALIMIVPGMIGSLMYPFIQLHRNPRPYGVEVVGDPYDVFSPNAFKHPLRSLIRQLSSFLLRQLCYHADAATYVTARFLQQRYPPGPQTFATFSSDVEMVCVESPPVIAGAQQQFRLINVGTMAQLYKAQDVLIKALAICVAHGLNVELILVGDGKHRPELETLARSLDLSERVKFCGQLPAGNAVRQQLDQADLFVMPSRQEGLPRALIEAMARGLPCIGTEIGGIPELLDEDSLVPVDDSHALAHKIRGVLVDPLRRRQLSVRNLEVAMQYQPHLMQARRETFYRHLKEKTSEWIRQTQK